MKQIEFLVPKLGMDTTEALVNKWLVKEGESFKKGDPLVELETEKVTFAVEAELDGVLARIAQPDGSVVPVGDALATLEVE